MQAKRGFLGNRSILDGDRGFWIMAGSDHWSPEQVTASLGQSWLLPQTGFKPYAACRWTHTAIDAVRALKEHHPELTPETVHGLRLDTFYEVAENLSKVDPADIIDAQFSVPHLLALELVGRSARCGLKETDLHDETVARVRRQVEVIEDPALSARYFQERAMPARLTVATTDGRELSVVVDDPWGNPRQPLAHDDILAKYRQLTVPIIGDAASERLLSGVLGLDEVESIRPFLPKER
jgi:2-methylcitrate dehydratase PrpD